MKRINQKIIAIILIIMLIVIGLNSQTVYAKTEADELKELLDEYKEDLGDLNQFKNVVDETYKDLYDATKVDDTLKQELKKDVEKFNNIDGINPLIVSILDIELNSQIDNLTDDNIDDMKEEISVIKEWVDSNVDESSDKNDSNISDDDGLDDNSEIPDQSIDNDDGTIADSQIPRAGVKCFISISLMIVIILAILFREKYRKLKEIK